MPSREVYFILNAKYKFVLDSVEITVIKYKNLISQAIIHLKI